MNLADFRVGEIIDLEVRGSVKGVLHIGMISYTFGLGSIEGARKR